MKNADNKEKVTIIVPVFQVIKYLRRCLDSILKQSYRNLEIIVVDDGSDDGSGEVCDLYAGKDSRITVIHKENGGVSRARNDALDIATGDYIFFLDADDFIETGAIATLHQEIKRTEADAAICNYRYVWEHSISKSSYSIRNMPIKDQVLDPEVIQKEKMFGDKPWFWSMVCGKLFKRKVFSELRFSPDRYYEDEFIFHKIYGVCDRIACVSAALYNYIQRYDSINGGKIDVRKLDSAEARLQRADYYANTPGFKETSLKTLLHSSFILFEYYHKTNARFDEVHRARNRELQKHFRDTYARTGQDRKHAPLSMKFWLLLSYWNMYFGGKARWLFQRMSISKLVFYTAYTVFSLCKLTLLKARILSSKKQGMSFLVMTPEHGNLGDHAIAEAEETLLGKNHINCFEVTGKSLLLLQRRGKLSIFDGSKIVINGGGNLGTIWPEYEGLIQDIFLSNPNSKILLMPSTVFYDGTEFGEYVADRSSKVINSHKNGMLFARERYSYEVMKRMYRNVWLSPDVVFTMNKCKDRTDREGCVLCFRSDRERILSSDEEKKIQEMAGDFYKKVTPSDMDLKTGISNRQRDRELNRKLELFASSELVITDRLHGMLFSVITGTPCLLLGSMSPKIEGSFQWVSELGYVFYAHDAEELLSILPDVVKNIKGKSFSYHAGYFANAFSSLFSYLSEFGK